MTLGMRTPDLEFKGTYRSLTSTKGRHKPIAAQAHVMAACAVLVCFFDEILVAVRVRCWSLMGQVLVLVGKICLSPLIVPLLLPVLLAPLLRVISLATLQVMAMVSIVVIRAVVPD